MISFDAYLKLGKVKKKSADPEEASSLMQKARNRLRYVEAQELDDDSAPFIFENAYLSAREAAQSLLSLAGFKPYSHEATIAFIKEHHSNILDEADAAEFDRLRQLRADSEYRAVNISVDEARECVAFAKSFTKRASKKLETAAARI